MLSPNRPESPRPPRMPLHAALDHLAPELDVRLVPWSRLGGDDPVAGAVDDHLSGDRLARNARESATAQLGQRPHPIPDVRRLLLLDVLDERPRLVVAAEERPVAEHLAPPAGRLDGECLDP